VTIFIILETKNLVSKSNFSCSGSYLNFTHIIIIILLLKQLDLKENKLKFECANKIIFLKENKQKREILLRFSL